MKTTLLLLACTGAALRASDPESAIPASFPAERYEMMIAKSPFALATPPAPVAAPPEKNFADGWFVSGLAQLDGKDFVTIKSRDLGVQFSLFGSDPRDGVTLQKVDWLPEIGRSTVTITKDGQTAKLEFNQAELQGGGGAPAMPNPMPQGGIRPPINNAGAIRPSVPRPAQPVIQPQQYGGGLQNTAIPGRGLVPPQPQQYAIPNANGLRPNGIPGPTPDSRRRIRVINNAPTQ